MVYDNLGKLCRMLQEEDESKAKFMKKVFIILTIIVLSLAGLSLFKSQILRFEIAGVASRIVGTPVHIKTLSFSLLKPTIRLSGFEVDNPAGFPKGVLESISTIKVTYDRAGLFKKKFHILTLEMDIKEIELIKNKEGLLNVDSLKIVKQLRKGPKNSSLFPLQIDLLTLGITKIVDKNYIREGEPAVKVYNVNIHQNYKNLTSAEQLVRLLTDVGTLRLAEIFALTRKDD